MDTFRVRWEIDVDADTPEEAAQVALVVMMGSVRPDFNATVFTVIPTVGENIEIDVNA
jgi:hypothetical protein